MIAVAPAGTGLEDGMLMRELSQWRQFPAL
jgi:hypothetical protein